MKTETTAPIGVQSHTLQVLDELVAQYTELPAAHITINRPYKRNEPGLSLLLDTPTDFNRWLEALAVPGDAVVLEPNGRGSWIQAHTKRDGINVTLSAHGILLTEDQLKAPRDTEAVEVSA